MMCNIKYIVIYVIFVTQRKRQISFFYRGQRSIFKKLKYLNFLGQFHQLFKGVVVRICDLGKNEKIIE